MLDHRSFLEAPGGQQCNFQLQIAELTFPKVDSIDKECCFCIVGLEDVKQVRGIAAGVSVGSLYLVACKPT